MDENKFQEENVSKNPLAELGAQLAALRESKNYSIDDITAATCVRADFIKAIESGDFDKFKALVYARGFTRNYCEFLEAPQLWQEYDSQLTLERFEQKARASEQARTAYRKAGGTYSMQPVKRMTGSQRSSSLVTPARGFRQSKLRRNCIIVLVLLLAVGGGALFANWDRIHAEIARIQSEQAYERMRQREQEQAQFEEARRVEEAAVQAEREAQASAEEAAPVEEAAPEPEPEPAPVLTVRARGDCWILVSVGDRVLTQRTVRRGWEGTFPLDDGLYMRLGNASNVQFSVDGTNFTTPPGGVRRYQFTPDGTATLVQRQSQRSQSSQR